jgi:hypothetical protein
MFEAFYENFFELSQSQQFGDKWGERRCAGPAVGMG